MISPDAERTTLVLVPFGLAATGIAVVLFDEPNLGPSLNGSAFVAAGILGELLILAQRLDRLVAAPIAVVTVVAPWFAFFLAWIVLLRTAAPHPF